MIDVLKEYDSSFKLAELFNQKSISIKIVCGGRRYFIDEKRDFSLNHFIQHFEAILESEKHNRISIDPLLVQKIVRKIKRLDSRGEALLKESSTCCFTACINKIILFFKRIFGNFNYNKQDHLQALVEKFPPPSFVTNTEGLPVGIETSLIKNSPLILFTKKLLALFERYSVQIYKGHMFEKKFFEYLKNVCGLDENEIIKDNLSNRLYIQRFVDEEDSTYFSTKDLNKEISELLLELNHLDTETFIEVLDIFKDTPSFFNYFAYAFLTLQRQKAFNYPDDERVNKHIRNINPEIDLCLFFNEIYPKALEEDFINPSDLKIHELKQALIISLQHINLSSLKDFRSLITEMSPRQMEFQEKIDRLITEYEIPDLIKNINQHFSFIYIQEFLNRNTFLQKDLLSQFKIDHPNIYYLFNLLIQNKELDAYLSEDPFYEKISDCKINVDLIKIFHGVDEELFDDIAKRLDFSFENNV